MKVSQQSILTRLEKAESFKAPQILAKTVKELREYVQIKTMEYNSPEAKAEREAKYQELQRIGELRRQAFQRGESMEKYPLPWETPEALKKQIQSNQEMIELISGVGLDTENLEEVDRSLRQKLQEASQPIQPT